MTDLYIVVNMLLLLSLFLATNMKVFVIFKRKFSEIYSD